MSGGQAATGSASGVISLSGGQRTASGATSFTLNADATGNAQAIDLLLRLGANGAFVLTLPAGAAGNAEALTFEIPVGSTSFTLPAGAIGNAQALTLQLPAGAAQAATTFAL